MSVRKRRLNFLPDKSENSSQGILEMIGLLQTFLGGRKHYINHHYHVASPASVIAPSSGCLK